MKQNLTRWAVAAAVLAWPAASWAAETAARVAACGCPCCCG